MTRGRQSTRGISDAIGIARSRGCVMTFTCEGEKVCDFMVRTPTRIIFVRVKRFLSILSAPEQIEGRLHDLVAQLRTFPASREIVCELWIYSKHGTFRFFRVTATGLVEIGRDGTEMRYADDGAGSPSGMVLPQDDPVAVPESS